MAFNANGNKRKFFILEQDVKRIVVVGERNVGKTAFINEFGIFQDAPEENYNCSIRCNKYHIANKDFDLMVLEIPSEENFPYHLKEYQYAQADVIIFMYAIDDPLSLEKLSTRWIPEVQKAIMGFNHQPKVALVANKEDLRNKGPNEFGSICPALQNQYLLSKQHLIDFSFPVDLPISPKTPPENRWELRANCSYGCIRQWIRIWEMCSFLD